ncbi:MAG: stage III sporulation protein AG [Lachnospiraceae bacterium]
MKINHFFTSLKKLKLSKDKLLLILLGGVLLVIISLPVKNDKNSSGQSKESAVTDSTITENAVITDTQDYAGALEKKLEEVLSGAEGVGKVRVLITLENSGELILKSDVKESVKNTGSGNGEQTEEITREENVIYQKDSDGSLTPYVTKTVYPTIAGVLVIAQGADDARVVSQIVEAVKAVLGIEANKIKVMKMEG